MMPLAVVSPYEYALVSDAIYADDLIIEVDGGADDTASREISTASASWAKRSKRDFPDRQRSLAEKGWRLIAFVTDEFGYRGGVFVQDARQLVVVAHRGSQNADSWVTDVESVVRLKPGHFVTAAIELLGHETVTAYRERGYTVSTTGHSLGGFLAQVCVFWAQREEQPPTYDPNLSAVVFDSPGVVDFLETLQSNLTSERGRIRIDRLNIQNFCAMPTVVSTFGRQTGTVWHLELSESPWFALVNTHRMVYLLDKFDPETGQPKQYRRMLDWPQADWSQYDSLGRALSQGASTAAKLPLTCLNALYKQLKGWAGYQSHETWYDRVVRDQVSQTSWFRAATSKTDYYPTEDELATFERRLALALHGHYASYPATHAGARRLPLYQFPPEVQRALTEICDANTLDLALGWPEEIQKHYGESGRALLMSLTLHQQGDREDVELAAAYPGTVFEAHAALIQLFRQHEAASLRQFVVDFLRSLDERVTALSTRQPSKVTVALRNAVADVDNALALKMMGPEDYAPERTREVAELAERLRAPGTEVTLYMNGALATKPGGAAVVMPSGSIDPSATATAASLMGLFATKGKGPRTETETAGTSAATSRDGEARTATGSDDRMDSGGPASGKA